MHSVFALFDRFCSYFSALKPSTPQGDGIEQPRDCVVKEVVCDDEDAIAEDLFTTE